MVSHVSFDNGIGTSASSTNCLIAGRASDMSLICRLSSGIASEGIYSGEFIYVPTATMVPCRLRSLGLMLGLRMGCVEGTITREH